jgi:glycosyltransferase involved in cell wall biosynthesis
MPDWTTGNPYQQKLIDASAELGIEITASNGRGFLPVLGALKECGRVDVLHVHWTHSFIFGSNVPFQYFHGWRFVLGLTIAKARGIRVVWTLHNLLDHERRNLRAELFFRRRIAKLADAVLVHCNYAREAASSAYGMSRREVGKFRVIPHPNFIGMYDDSLSEAEARASLGLSESDLVFLFFGNIRSYKGVFDLLDAFRKLSFPQAQLLIVGRPWNDDTANALADAVRGDTRVRTVARFVDPSEVQVFFRAADYVVFPYRDVLTSGSMLLAMSFAKAVIAPRLGCIPETVDEQCAILYEPRGGESLLEALVAAAGCDAATMGAASRRRAEQLTWEEAARTSALAYGRDEAMTAEPG